MFNRNPDKSTHQAARESGLSRYTICKVLKEELDIHSRKPHHVQELTLEDSDRRMEYGELMLGWHKDFPRLFENILWSDEAIIPCRRFRQSTHLPLLGGAGSQYNGGEDAESSESFTLWCGMTARSLVGPYLLRDTIKFERYSQMLQDYVRPMVSGWENIDYLIFMQDGAPPNFANAVHA
jgi:hypothetical protein